MKRTLLLSADGEVSGGTPGAPPALPTPNAPDPPPVAKLVAESDVKESDAGDIVELRRKLAEQERSRKLAETRAAELEDECHRLRAPAPTPKPKSKESIWDEFFGD